MNWLRAKYLLAPVIAISIIASVSIFSAKPSHAFGGNGPLRLPVPVTAFALRPQADGGWAITRDGGVFTFGNAQGLGAANQWIRNTVTAAFSSPSGNGYTMITNDGGVFTFGDSQAYGAANMWIRNTVTAAFPTPTGRGYTMITNDGGVFTFGDAQAYGAGNTWIRNTVMAAFPTSTGRGYTMVTNDGGVFTFGDAQAYGAGNAWIRNTVEAAFPTSTDRGYWMVTDDGGTFSFGDAQGLGAANNGCVTSRVAAGASALNASAYWIVTEQGEVRGFTPGNNGCPYSGGSSGGGGTAKENAIAADLLYRLNSERAARGLPALGWDNGLASSARSWSTTMSSRNSFVHSNLYPLLGRFNTAAENIAVGGSTTKAGSIHGAWMRSTGHRVNLLARNLDVIGIGVYCASDGRVWITQQFGRFPYSGLPSGFGSTPAQDPIHYGDASGPSCQ